MESRQIVSEEENRFDAPFFRNLLDKESPDRAGRPGLHYLDPRRLGAGIVWLPRWIAGTNFCGFVLWVHLDPGQIGSTNLTFDL
jgi:hypothetical protein